jgi:phospholipase/lecithinase/hemolysin
MIIDILARLKRASVPLVAVAIATLSVSTNAQSEPGGTPSSNSPFSAIYVIGDSLSDTGRTSAALTTNPLFPFPPAPYAAGHMSNGAVWIEYFAPMVRKTYNPDENLAWAGAMTGVFNVFNEALPGMQQQLTQLHSRANGSFDKKALYVVFGGSNDFLQISLPSAGNAATVISEAVRNLMSITIILRTLGAENIVVVDVPDLGQTPRVLRLGTNAAVIGTQLSMAFNSLLDSSLNNLSFPVRRVSLFNLMRDFVDKPKKYGFTNVTEPSFPDLSKGQTYLFWDDVHPTTLGHRHLADEVFHVVVKAGLLSQKPN